MVTGAGPRVDPAAELGIACLVNAGRWQEIEPFVARFEDWERSPQIEIALATARVRAGKWEEAIQQLVEAAQRHPSNSSVREFALRILMARADDRIRAQQWREASDLVGKALVIDPKNSAA